MDRVKLKHILTHLHDIITNDVPGLEFRIYFYGSRQGGTERPDSDLDLAIEFLSPLEDGEAVGLTATYYFCGDKFTRATITRKMESLTTSGLPYGVR